MQVNHIYKQKSGIKRINKGFLSGKKEFGLIYDRRRIENPI